MNPFEDPTKLDYKALIIQRFGEVSYVDAVRILDIIKARAIMTLRLLSSPVIETRITDFERGRYAELKEIYEALNVHNSQ